MPNKILVAQEFHCKTKTGKYIKAVPQVRFDDTNQWDITVYDTERRPITELVGWPEDRTLAFMEYYECDDLKG